MLGDLMLCNVLFSLACRMDGLYEGTALMQSHLLVTAVYFGCTVNGGIILHFKKVRNYQIVGRVLRNVFFFSVVATVMLSWGRFAFSTWSIYAGYLFAMLVVISGFRLGVRRLIKWYWQKNRHKNGVVFVGSTENNVTLYHELLDDPSIGYRVCGYFDAKPNKDFPEGCAYLGTTADVIPYLQTHETQVRNLYCCLPSLQKDEILPIISYCENHLVRFYSVPNVRNYLYHLSPHALQHDGQRTLSESARGAAQLGREPDTEACLRHHVLAGLPLHAVYPDTHRGQHHH